MTNEAIREAAGEEWLEVWLESGEAMTISSRPSGT